MMLRSMCWPSVDNLLQALREAWHDYEAEGVVGIMAEWKMSFWQEQFDQYSDSLFWVHK